MTATTLTTFADDVWLDSEPVKYLGMQITATMTVIRLRDGKLLLHSPAEMSAARRESVTKLGEVAHLYAPNTMHFYWMSQWNDAFPSAKIHAPRGLSKMLTIDRVLGDAPDVAFGDDVKERLIDGFYLQEAVLFHAKSKTLVVTDLLQNIGRPTHAWTRFYSKLMGFYDRAALSAFIRMTAFGNRKQARQAVLDVLGWPFERIIVGHGLPVLTNAKETLADAYAFLM